MIELSAFLVPANGRDVASILRRLENAGFIGHAPRADTNQLDAAANHPLLAALRAQPDPSYDELTTLLLEAPSGESTVHLYAPLVAPAELPEPLRGTARAQLGYLAQADPRAPFDPLELIIPIDLTDLDGRRRADLHRDMEPFEAGGLPSSVRLLSPARGTTMTFENLAELRVMSVSVPYVAFALAHALDDTPIYVMPLEED